MFIVVQCFHILFFDNLPKFYSRPIWTQATFILQLNVTLLIRTQYIQRCKSTVTVDRGTLGERRCYSTLDLCIRNPPNPQPTHPSQTHLHQITSTQTLQPGQRCLTVNTTRCYKEPDTWCSVQCRSYLCDGHWAVECRESRSGTTVCQLVCVTGTFHLCCFTLDCLALSSASMLQHLTIKLVTFGIHALQTQRYFAFTLCDILNCYF